MKALTLKRILVPTDFSEPAANALRYASSLAARSGASLVVLHADPFIPAIDFTGIPAGEFEVARQKLVDSARLRLEAHVQANVNPLVSSELEVLVADPVSAIEQASRSVDLVVMGTHGRTGITRMIFGSVTASVMRLASVPVLAVTSETRNTHVRRIASVVTFTNACRAALRYTSSLFEAPIVLLRGNDVETLREAVDESIHLYDWIPPDLDKRCTISVMPAQSGPEEVVAFAKYNDVDLIVIDVPSEQRVMDFIRGTVAEKIMASSGCPVLTVNARAAESMAIADIARALAHSR